MTILFAAESPPWTDRYGFWVALLALTVSCLAVRYARSSAASGKTSADAATKSADAAEKATMIAERAAESASVAAHAAEKSAEADGKLAQVELDRDHEAYRPAPVSQGFVKTPTGAGGRNQIFFELVLPRAYRVAGEVVYETLERHIEIDPGPIMQAGRLTRFLIWEEQIGLAPPALLRLRFSPPQPDDPGEVWDCRCGNTVMNGMAHWVWNVKVSDAAEFGYGQTSG